MLETTTKVSKRTLLTYCFCICFENIDQNKVPNHIYWAINEAASKLDEFNPGATLKELARDLIIDMICEDK